MKNLPNQSKESIMAQVTQALTIEGQLHMDEAQKKIVKLPKYGVWRTNRQALPAPHQLPAR